METHVGRWGNSLAVRIPKAFAAELGVTEEAAVEVSLRDGALIVEPMRHAHERLDLGQLLREIPADYVAEDVDWGPAAGREVW